MAMEHPDRFVMKPQREGGGKFITAQFVLVSFCICLADGCILNEIHVSYVSKLTSHHFLITFSIYSSHSCNVITNMSKGIHCA